MVFYPMNDQVRSAVRTLDILEVLSTAEGGLSLGEIARLINAPKSSTLMLLRTLIDRSYLERSAGECYRINPTLLDNETGWIGGHLSLLVRRAQPIMRRLSDSVRETCLLAVLTPDLHVRLLAKEVSPREIRYDTSLDKLNPAHRIASGRVQLAHLSEIEIAAYVARWTGRSVPPSERLDEVALRADLAQVREAGVALAVDQWEAGATGISAPIFDASGRVDAAITVGAVTARFLADREEIIAATQQAALDITELQRSRAPAQGRAARDTSPGVVRPDIRNMVATSQPKGKKHARS